MDAIAPVEFPLKERDLTMSDVTRILSEIESGDPSAAAQLLPLVYDELRKLAAARLTQEKPGQTLQATALVHEAYLKLGGPFENSRHFFGAAAEAMRRILVENARRKARLKHGGGRQRYELQEGDLFLPRPDEQLLTLDDALTRLALVHPQFSKLVEQRYFTELTIEQTAALLGDSPSSLKRNWVYASAWLRREIERGEDVPHRSESKTPNHMLRILDYFGFKRRIAKGIHFIPSDVSSGLQPIQNNLSSWQPLICRPPLSVLPTSRELVEVTRNCWPKGTIHRAIKPSSVLVAEYDRQPIPKVIDFSRQNRLSVCPSGAEVRFTSVGNCIERQPAKLLRMVRPPQVTAILFAATNSPAGLA